LIFVLEFCDKWMLQRFGGAGQQGYFQVANQFAALSLLATSSILNIFWKEIAEAHGQGNMQRVADIYKKVNRGLVMFAAITSGFLIPWSREIVVIILGPTYLNAVPVLMIMFLYPIHQTMGQIGSVMLLATENTRAYMKIGIFISLCFFPVSYFMQAPTDFLPFPGLGLGAVGMAYKTVAINIVSVNVLAWFIARICRWRYDWMFQVIGITSVLCIGYLVKLPMKYFFELDKISNNSGFIAPILLAFLLYAGLTILFIWKMPWLIGVEKSDLMKYLKRIHI
jgi:O-antigen/teichoic acid export membrane protein